MRNPGPSVPAKVAISAAATLAVALLVLWWTIDSRAGDPGRSDLHGAAGPSTDACRRDPAAGAHARDALAPAAGPGFFAAPAGSEFGYEFSGLVRSGVEIAMADQPIAQRLVLRLRGAMTVLVVARRDAELIAQVGFAGVSANQGVGGSEERSPALEELLALPAFVRMRDDG